MSWYRTGTVTVTNGSPTVTGAGTDFVANAQIGHAFLGADGRVYEIAQVVSAAQVTLAAAYMGASGGGQGYAIMPTSSFARDLALGAAELLNSFSVVRDTIGQGLMAGGTFNAPGLRFNGDQDTGIISPAPNTIGLVTGAHWAAWLASDRLMLRSTVGDRNMTDVERTYAAYDFLGAGGYALGGMRTYQPATFFQDSAGLAFSVSYGTLAEAMRIDPFGRCLLGTKTDYGLSCHTIQNGQNEGHRILNVTCSEAASVQFFGGSNGAMASAAACARFYGNAATGRSINAAGTINASGADYAEYMTKAAGCGTIAAGDVCGVDIDGRLTKTWADARSFVVKSSDPAYVGGDVWGQSVGPAPDRPGAEPITPPAPPAAPASEDEADLAAWRDIVAAYPVRLAAYQANHSAWSAAQDAYATAKAAWDAALEAERVKVDRIAFSGQVPVNVAGNFEVGDYLIAAAQGAGIKAVAVPADTITFDQYRRRLGKVWAVRDGRAWVDVQHG